jgi:hypothetical protein
MTMKLQVTIFAAVLGVFSAACTAEVVQPAPKQEVSAPDAAVEADAGIQECQSGETSCYATAADGGFAQVCVKLLPGCVCGKVLSDGTHCSPS